MCYRPIQIPRKYLYNDKYLGADGFSFITVPCGKCGECIKRRKQSWSIRLMLESLSYSDSIFLTLTYDDLSIPLVKCGDDGVVYSTLFKRDLQNFWKRLRKDLDLQGRRIKYFACGEYGDNTQRPHYHAIVYGLSMYDRELIEENWDKGFCKIGSVTIESCNYVSGYIQKKLDKSDKDYFPRNPEFQCMSRGIGKDYLIEHFEELISDGFIRFNGRKIPLPRYFWKILEDEDIFDRFQIKRFKDVLSKKYLDEKSKHLAKIGLVDEYQQYRYSLEEMDAKERRYENLKKIKRGNL